MAVLGEIVELLKRWDVWRRVEGTPDRLDALEKRVSELEAKLQRAPGAACPRCGALDYRVEKSEPHRGAFASMGVRIYTMKCGACGFTDEKTINPR